MQHSQKAVLFFTNPEFLERERHEGVFHPVPGQFAVDHESLSRSQLDTRLLEDLLKSSGVDGKLPAPMPELNLLRIRAFH